MAPGTSSRRERGAATRSCPSLHGGAGFLGFGALRLVRAGVGRCVCALRGLFVPLTRRVLGCGGGRGAMIWFC